MPPSKRGYVSVTITLATVLLAVVVRDIVVDWRIEDKPLWSTVAENSVSILLCVCIGASGLWLYRNRGRPYLHQAVRWQLLGGVVVFGLIGWVVLLQVIQGELKPVLLVFQTTIGGVLGGTVVGYANARTEETLANAQRERDRFEALFENAPAEIAEVCHTAAGIDVLRTNARFETTFDDRDHDDIDSFVDHLDQDEATADLIEEGITAQEPLETEATVETHDGERAFQLRVAPLGDDRAYLIYSDITEMKAAQRELEQSVARLERSNARLEEFAYIASHDLQEPLRTVSRYVEIIEAEYGDAFDETGQEYVETVVTATGRMQSMINGLLDYSRVTTRGSEFEPVDIEAVVEEVLEDLELLREEADGSVTVESLPPAKGDREQLWQVFQNLVKNAFEHSGDESVTVTVSGARTEEGCRFVVEDDGPGIDEYLVDDLFDMFESGENYQTERQARGIGLAVVERIVERHGGNIWVESERGEGSRFVFTIPQS
jgi:signal transduction histidine kinase